MVDMNSYFVLIYTLLCIESVYCLSPVSLKKQVKMINSNRQEKFRVCMFFNLFHHYILIHIALWEMKNYMQNVWYVKEI